MIRLAVLVSGSGTNLQVIMDAIGQGTLDSEITLVVSNRRAAYGLARAEGAGIPTLYFPLKAYTDAGKTREQYDHDLARRIAATNPDLIVLAGWMHIVSPAFLDVFPNRVINLHPALPGTFAGTQCIERTYAAFQQGDVTCGGCMVHYVIPEVDAGVVIVQETVPIFEADTLADFELRIHEAEHRVIIQAIQLVGHTLREENE